MHGLVKPGRDVVARRIPVIGDVGVVADNNQQEAPRAVREQSERIPGGEMDLHDRAPVALLQHERHVRGARPALIRRHDHAEAPSGCEFQRLLLLDAELGAEDMHGGALVDWLEDKPRLTHDPVKSETILARERGCQE
ncbi:hypothetical protein ACVWZW_002174 [Bradyrhizobium sp. F1.13.4]